MPKFVELRYYCENLIHFITWVAFLRPTGALASARNQVIKAIRIPKHLNAVSKIRLLKCSLDVTFFYYTLFLSIKAALNEYIVPPSGSIYPCQLFSFKMEKKIYRIYLWCSHLERRWSHLYDLKRASSL